MSGVIGKILADGVPVRVVADQQDIAHERDRKMNEPCEMCGELPCKCMGEYDKD